MTELLGRGLCGSLKARVNHEIRKLARSNTTLLRARYSLRRRLLREMVVNRSVGQLILLYSVISAVTLASDWAANHWLPWGLPSRTSDFDSGFLKDVASYLISGQIGILAIVSVAVGVVTLLSERNDNVSVNTDIRLYYVESYSYESAISGIALLIVLTTELFWPIHHILAAIGVSGLDDWSKIALTGLHTLWFCVNLALFHQFITTTLRFVEPSTRETLRERYSANEIIPYDAKIRLQRALYGNVARQMFGEEDLKDGPEVAFGYAPRMDGGEVEIAMTFRKPTALIDVRLRPLRWAITRWRNRVRKLPKSAARLGQPPWDAYLTIAPHFDGTLDGKCNVVVRRGGVALTSLEKWLIRRSLRFAPVSSRANDTPSLDNFLEQLINKMIWQIEQTAETGFRTALDEVVRYHTFLLAAQNTKDESGNPFNLAEVGGFFSRPDADWVRQYRRAFAAGAEKIGADTVFIDRLSTLAWRLIPDDGLNFSQRVLQTLLELGLHQVASLEDWVTRRAVIGAASEYGTSPSLAGSDKHAYEEVLIGFVGGWERVAQTLIFSLSLGRRPNAAAQASQWHAFVKGFPVFQTHLHYTAYFLVAAVWNDDAIGADRYRDLLLRWLNPFYANLQSTFLFQNTFLLTPDVARQDWREVHANVVQRMRFREEAALPGPISGILLWELHCDVVCIAGLIPLYWYATGQQPSETAAEAAVLTLRGQKRDADGSDLTTTTQKSLFRLLLEFLIRYALNPRFAEGQYSATIEGLVRLLTNLASPRMVSGRIYGGYGIDGFETLRFVFLAAMAANLPASGDADVSATVQTIKTDPLFSSDKSVRNFTWTLRQMFQTLDQGQNSEPYKKAAYAFNGEFDLAAATMQLKTILASIVATFEALRAERLRNAPLDEDRMSLVRHRMSAAALALGPGFPCFQHYEVRRDSTGAVPETASEFGVVDKGLFTLPEMSPATFDDVPGLFMDVFRGVLSNSVWRDLYRRPKRVIGSDISTGTDAFWSKVVAEASNIGPEPILLVPSELGEEIGMAEFRGAPAGFSITRAVGMASGGGMGYMGSIEGIPVYSAQALRHQAILCSGRLLRVVAYGTVHGQDEVADFSFIDGEDLERSRIQIRFAQRTEWADDVFVEFALSREAQEAPAETSLDK